jgi:hypothetical protein
MNTQKLYWQSLLKQYKVPQAAQVKNLTARLKQIPEVGQSIPAISS